MEEAIGEKGSAGSEGEEGEGSAEAPEGWPRLAAGW